MKISFTKKQFEALFRLCYIGNWIANAQRTGAKDDPMIEKYEEIYKYVQSFAPEFGLDKMVQFDKEMNCYFATREFEESEDTHGLIDEYDENSFWDDLVDNLIDRDFDKAYSKKARDKMSFEEYSSKRQPFEDKWNEEIDKHGVTRLNAL
jgi:hypothetical protein